MDILIGKLKGAKIFQNLYFLKFGNNKKISNKNKCIYLERNKKFCNNIIPWSEVINEVVNTIPEEEDTILMWCHTTTLSLIVITKQLKYLKIRILK